MNGVITLINKAIGKINGIKVPDWVPGMGGKNLSIPTIPALAKGGIVNKATLAMIGEGKSAEAVIPLDRTLTKYMAEAIRQAGGNNNITLQFYPQQMTEANLKEAFDYIDRRYGRMAY
nr:MAG TPA: minor tail protein [Caudoviricetes sp.]